MKTIPEFKKSKHYLHQVEMPCLAATIKNSELPTPYAQHFLTGKPDPKCIFYLRGKSASEISGWQKRQLELLFEKNGLACAVVDGMKSATNDDGGFDDLDENEIRQIRDSGIESFVTISMVAVDEVEEVVVVVARTIFDCVLDEHGIVLVLSDGKWRFEDDTYLNTLIGSLMAKQEDEKKHKWQSTWESVFPRPSDGVLVTSDASHLFGVWRYDLHETVRVRKLLGLSAREVKEAHTSGFSLGRYFSPASSEHLSHGENILERKVVQYERRENWITVRYAEHKTPALAKPVEYWCDGKLLIERFDKDVYTRVDDSYRRPARVVQADPHFADFMKQIRAEKSR